MTQSTELTGAGDDEQIRLEPDQHEMAAPTRECIERALIECNDPAESAQFKPLKRKPERRSSWYASHTKLLTPSPRPKRKQIADDS